MSAPLTTSGHLVGKAGQIVQIEGLYRVQNIFPRKIMKELPDGRIVSSSKVVHLGLSDDTTVRLWVRPDDEMQAFSGRQVIATGKLLLPEEQDASMAAPNAVPSLVEISGIAAVE